MALRIREFPVAREFPEQREIPVTQEFPRLKLFPPVSHETGISREFPVRGFLLNITALWQSLSTAASIYFEEEQTATMIKKLPHLRKSIHQHLKGRDHF